MFFSQLIELSTETHIPCEEWQGPLVGGNCEKCDWTVAKYFLKVKVFVVVWWFHLGITTKPSLLFFHNFHSGCLP